MNAARLPESGAAQLVRLANRESMRLGRENGELPPNADSEGGNHPMSTINLQEFGRLQSEVATLRRDQDRQLEMLTKLVEDVGTIKDKVSEVRGGWKVLTAVGGAAAGIGGVVMAYAHKAFKILS